MRYFLFGAAAVAAAVTMSKFVLQFFSRFASIVRAIVPVNFSVNVFVAFNGLLEHFVSNEN